MKKTITMLMAALSTIGVLAQQRHVSYRFTQHYNQKVAEFEHRNDIDSTKIVMLGNSLTEFGRNWNTRLDADNICNYGIMGDNTQGMLRRLCQITPCHPRAVFLMCGINDVNPKYSAEDIFERIKSVIDSIRSQAPRTRLFVQSLLPINEKVRTWRPLRGQTDSIPRINTLLKDYCQSIGIPYIDIFPHLTFPGTNMLDACYTRDGLHVNEEGYAIWAGELKPYIRMCNDEPAE